MFQLTSPTQQGNEEGYEQALSFSFVKVGVELSGY